VWLWLFWRWGLRKCWAGLVLNLSPLISASQVAGIIGVSHCTQPIQEDLL
jgi:hypothetical protein